MVAATTPFDRRTLELAFERLGAIAAAEGKVIEISVYGGSALLLTFDQRAATRDVDAVFDKDRDFVRRAAVHVAREFGWPANWINDGVKGFLSARDLQPEAKSLFRSYPLSGDAGLRVFVASPSYLFAMKCMAMRLGGTESSQDVDDIRLLGVELGIRTFDEAIALVSQYYSDERISPKTQFGLQEIFEGDGGRIGDADE
jgi:hypothetical protein